MPVILYCDDLIGRAQLNNNTFYRWGKKGKRYYFDPKDEKSQKSAYNKAFRQGQAILSQSKNDNDCLTVVF
jgi:hypothetical protein